MEFLRSLCEINDKGGTDLNCWLCKSICYSTERSLGYKKKDISHRFFCEINDKGETDLNCQLCKSICYSTERSIGNKKKREFTVFEIFLRNKKQRRNIFNLSFVRNHPLLVPAKDFLDTKKKENSQSLRSFWK